MMSTKVLCVTTSKLGNSSSYSICAVMYVCNCSEVKGKLIIGCFPKIVSAVWLMLLCKSEVNSMSLNTWLDSSVLNFLNMSGKHFRRKKFSQEEIFATWCLIVKISKISASRKVLTIRYMGQFCIEITDYSVVHLITSLHSKRCIAELPLRVGLIHALWTR